ncbi:universal stress protein [Brachybacterium sacelli]|uniref:Nucleotide-binding universal stress UspA family protein n=1 Tax=Brachybacterium sacelli TaxID=173364 RepID=A0ABS4X8A6_9MICO|nr:universal stress protein [Brachybacterium sacelli]MBP2383934.1 nucleotide-binding universal stress UspA family protein [Brachybacterium sacelli]
MTHLTPQMPQSTSPTITVGVFDADESDLAVRWAARHAERVGGTLHLIHAFMWTELDVNTDPIPGMTGSGIRNAAHRLVEDARDLAREGHPDLPITSEIVDGNAVPVLVDASGASDVMVVGGRGLGRLLTLIVGSKSLALAARSHCPVVVVRGDIEHEGPIGLVHHETATEVVTRAADLAVAYERDVHLVVRADTSPDEAEEIRARTAERIALSHPSVVVGDVRIAASGTAKELVHASEVASMMVVAGERTHGPDKSVSAPRQLVTVLRFANTPVWIERD